MNTSSRFTLFQALTTELRFKIWEYALPDHVIVDFIPKSGTEEFIMAVGELNSVRPVLPTYQSHIARTCKEAWHVMKGPRHRSEFAAASEESTYYLAGWLDISRTTFFLGHGEFSFYCIDALAPKPISAQVRSLAVVWSSYRDVIETCKRLTVFQTIQQLVILIPPELGLRIQPRLRAAFTVLDLYLQGKICQVDDPFAAGSHLKSLVEEFLLHQCTNLGPKWPTVEVVIVQDLE
ncbi:hypothetical protein V494_05300 [Pseudogymnoascus sp. VKM F-4513 (FW-928)]|nr:hypothetical protein V494_05300 [Pseudogymnoascus sp. VKM F-4513 (FW-928)]